MKAEILQDQTLGTKDGTAVLGPVLYLEAENAKERVEMQIQLFTNNETDMAIVVPVYVLGLLFKEMFRK